MISSNWNKPVNNSNTASPLSSRAATPNASTDDLTKKKPVVRTTTSARLKNNNTAAKKSILSGKGNGPRTSRLAAKRINKTEDDIDFDEIEKKAKQEAEEAKKLGYKPTETVEPTVKKQPTSTSLSLKRKMKK